MIDRRIERWLIKTTDDFCPNYDGGGVEVSVRELYRVAKSTPVEVDTIMISVWGRDDTGYVLNLPIQPELVRHGRPTFELGLLIARNLPTPITVTELVKLGFERFRRQDRA